MKILSHHREITFDDILLLPNKSSLFYREDDYKIQLKTRISRTVTLDIPLVSSPMPGVTESKMAIALGKKGGLGFIHYFQGFERQLQEVYKVKQEKVKVAATVSALNEKGLIHIGNLLKAGTNLISLDTAHAFNTPVIRFVQKIKRRYPTIDLNVAVVVTPEAVKALAQAGVDSIRVGIGPGSHCTTRIVTGVGRPQLSAVKACYLIAKKYRIPLISEGGIKDPGDIPKALVFGADAVMIGSLFSATDEAPGNIIRKNGKKYKYSWGNCTNSAIEYKHLQMNESLFTAIKKKVKKIITRQSDVINNDYIYYIEEGVEGLILYKGSVNPIIDHLVSGLRRSMWYQGASTMSALRKKAVVVFVSPNTLLENKPRI